MLNTALATGPGQLSLTVKGTVTSVLFQPYGLAAGAPAWNTRLGGSVSSTVTVCVQGADALPEASVAIQAILVVASAG